MTSFSVDPDAIRAMSTGVGLCLDTIPSGRLPACDDCGSSAVAGAIDEFGVWRRVTWNEVSASVNELCSSAIAAAEHYSSTDESVADAADAAN